MQTSLESCLAINAPEWYLRQDFQDFLEGRRPGQLGPPATWHRPGTAPDEFSDVFVTFDGGEGSDADALPADIWMAIRAAADHYRMTYGVVWIRNLDAAVA